MADPATDWVDYELPEHIAEMRRLTSTATVKAIVDTWGGRPLCFPLHFDPEHALVVVAGHAHAAKLIEHYGGDRIYIPKMEAIMRSIRNAEIRARFDGGMNATSLAREYGLTERHIWNILGRFPAAPPQDDLFPSD